MGRFWEVAGVSSAGPGGSGTREQPVILPMMLKREFAPQDGTNIVVPQRGRRVGSSVLGIFAGVAVLCVGTTVATLAGAHSASVQASTGQCQVLPAAPATTPAGPTPTGTPAAGVHSPKPSSSWSTASSNSPSAATSQICVSVEAATSSVRPGQDALYKISVWPTGGAADDVTVQISAIAGHQSPSLPAPTFTYCGVGAGSQTCTVGTMRVNQATQLQAQIVVPSSAPSGDTATLAATVTAAAPGASTTGSITGSATADVVAAPPTSPTPTPTPTPTRTSSGGHGHGHTGGSSGNSGSGSSGSSVGSPIGNITLPGTTGGNGITNSITGQNPSGLFPTIGPSSSTPSSGTVQGNSRTRVHTPYRARTVADILPLNSGQLSGQAAGLIVLGIGIILVFARISLRRARPAEGKD